MKREHLYPAPPGYFILIFQDETNLPILKFLKRGFRHCFAYQINPDQKIIEVNTLSNITNINIINNITPLSLIQKHREKGHYCLIYPKRDSPPLKIAPPLPFTCVETAKRLIGIHSWQILTPWQLYKYIREQNMKINIDL